MNELFTKFADWYTKAFAFTGPITFTLLVVRTEKAYDEKRSIVPEIAKGIVDIGTCGAVSVFNGVRALAVARKLNATATTTDEIATLKTKTSTQVDEHSPTHVESHPKD